jgi:hypothetical protein
MTDERAKRFNDLMEQIEVGAYSIRTGGEHDVLFSLAVLQETLGKALRLFGQISAEALDKVVGSE